MPEKRPDYIVEAMELMGIDLDAPKQIITEVSGFTPMFDAVVNQYHDETRAAVHGITWRYCQMEDRVCKAKLETMAKQIGIDASTFYRHIKALCEDGYFVDLTPGLRNKPHVYAETGKIVMTGSLKAGLAQKNVGTAQKNVTPSQSAMNKVLKKESKEINDNDKALATLSKLYSDNIGAITPLGADLLRNMSIDYPESWFVPAFEIAVKNNARNLKYIETILKSWKDHEFGWKPVGKHTKHEESPNPQEPKAFAAIREWERMTADNGNA